MTPELNKVLENMASKRKRLWASFCPSFPFPYIKQLWLCLHSRFLDQETLYFGIVDTHESAWKSCWSSLSKINRAVFFLWCSPCLVSECIYFHSRSSGSRSGKSPKCKDSVLCPLMLPSPAKQSCSNFILVLRTLFMLFVLGIKY